MRGIGHETSLPSAGTSGKTPVSEAEMSQTQKNKFTTHHLGFFKVCLAKVEENSIKWA